MKGQQKQLAAHHSPRTSSEVPFATSQISSLESHHVEIAVRPQFGLTKKRSCTDIFFLFLFASCLAGWAVIAWFAFKNGDPKILVQPVDSNGELCGLYRLKDKPYLYFFDLVQCANPTTIFKGCPTTQVCVSQCPNETFTLSPDTPKEKIICSSDADLSKPILDLVKARQCAGYYLKSTPLLRRCIPVVFMNLHNESVVDNLNKTLLDQNGDEITFTALRKAAKFLALFLNTKNIGSRLFSDMKQSWPIIILALVVIVIACFLWVLLMRWFAGYMVWFSIFAVTGLSIYASYYSISKYVKMDVPADSHVTSAFKYNLSTFLENKNTWLAFAIISLFILLLMLILLIFLRTRLKIAIGLLHEASKAVSLMMSSVFFPFIPYTLQLGAVIFWGGVALYIASSGRAVFQIGGNSTDPSVKFGYPCDPHNFTVPGAYCQFKLLGEKDGMRGAQFYNFFMMIWVVFFFIGVGEVSLASAFSSYYWALNKSKDIPFFAVIAGFCCCVRYHLGSVAFGSFLIAIVRTIRMILEYISKKCKKYDNSVTKALLCMCKCCFWCLEKFLIFISKNAYIMVAIYGRNFCSSAKEACSLLIRNVVRVVVVDKVTDFLLFIGKFAIVGGSAIGSFYLFTSNIQHLNKYVPKLNYHFVPILIITFGAYYISSIFFNVYSMAVDTLFLCFLEDLEKNDGSKERPYFMSKELMKILHKENKYREPEMELKPGSSTHFHQHPQ